LFELYIPIFIRYKPPIMLIFLALLAAEQCVAVKLAADPLSRASQRRQISLPASLPAQTAGTGIGWLSYTMSVGGGYHFFGRKGRGYLNSDLRPTMPLTPSVSNYGRTPHGSKRCITQYVLNLFMTWYLIIKLWSFCFQTSLMIWPISHLTLNNGQSTVGTGHLLVNSKLVSKRWI
jgi:hypothetical protein